MKMHRKFRQNANEPLKDFSIGNPCTCLTGQPSLDDQHYFVKPNCGIRRLKQAQREPARKSFPGLGESARKEEYYDEKDSSPSAAAISDHFDGFLSIGTLGSDPVANDPPTPTFAISVENITEKETEVTEDELKVINEELEKVLGAEAKEDGCNFSSARSSHVSNGRSSHGSTITLSGSETNGSGTTTFPLQGYLLGAAVDLSETTTAAKKENRTSLGELFQKTKLSEENPADVSDKEEKRIDKDGEKSAVHLMKKMLKKKMHKSSNTNASGTAESAPTETKLHKILHMFHRKVHPESLTSTKKHGKLRKSEKKNNSCNGGQNNGDVHPGEDLMIYSQRPPSRGTPRYYRSQSNPPLFAVDGIDSNGNREYWIKTDAEYLVLEL